MTKVERRSLGPDTQGKLITGVCQASESCQKPRSFACVWMPADCPALNRKFLAAPQNAHVICRL